MELYTLSRKQRQIHRSERYLKFLEKEQLKNIREIKGTLETAKRRLERRRDWLKELEEVLSEEETHLQELKGEFISLLDEAVYETVKARSYLEEQMQDTQRELRQLEEHTGVLEEGEPQPAVEPPPAKVLVRPLEDEELAGEQEETQVRVQWYHPSQNGPV